MTDKELATALEELICQRTKKDGICVPKTMINEVGQLLHGFGLVSLSENPHTGQQLIMVTLPGYGLVKEDLFRMFPTPQEKVGTGEVTFGTVARDISHLVAGIFSGRKQ